jgi:hypothetical protein
MKWVADLATRLRTEDAIDVVLDQWHAVPGDQLPHFMEKAVRESDFVLIICTLRYQARSDNRAGGAGYEGDIMTGQVLTKANWRKFIPLLREGDPETSRPTWLTGSYALDFRGDPYPSASYSTLVQTLTGTLPQAPPLGKR